MRSAPKRSALFSVLGILGEILLTLAVLCGLYIAWQLWWTGVESSQSQLQQRQSVSWSDTCQRKRHSRFGGEPLRQGDPPVQPTSANGG
jgi:hypothetical protein